MNPLEHSNAIQWKLLYHILYAVKRQSYNLLFFFYFTFSSGKFWKSIAGDLESYAKHAQRKTIMDDDVTLLMRRCVLWFFTFFYFFILEKNWKSENYIEKSSPWSSRGARCSSVVRAFAHGAMGRSFMVDQLSYFSFQPVLHDWCNKGCGMC